MNYNNDERDERKSRHKVNRPRRKVFLRRMRIHLLVVMGIITIALIGVAVRLIQLNVKKGREYAGRVLSQRNYTSTAVPYKRGEILDRNGSVLAMSSKVYNLIIEPKNILRDEEKKAATVKALVMHFDVTEAELEKYFEDKNSLYDVLRKGLSYEQVKKFNEYAKEQDDTENVHSRGHTRSDACPLWHHRFPLLSPQCQSVCPVFQ